jgi:hypothetical protein
MKSSNIGNSFQIESQTISISQQIDAYMQPVHLEGQKSIESQYRRSRTNIDDPPGKINKSFSEIKTPRELNSRENSSDIRLDCRYQPIKQSFPEAYSNLISALDSISHYKQEEPPVLAESRKSISHSRQEKQFNPYYKGNDGDVSITCTMKSYQSDSNRKSPGESNLIKLVAHEQGSQLLNKHFIRLLELGILKIQKICDSKFKQILYDNLRRLNRTRLMVMILKNMVENQTRFSFGVLRIIPLKIETTIKPISNSKSDYSSRILLEKSFKGLRDATRRQKRLLINVRNAALLEKAFKLWRCKSRESHVHKKSKAALFYKKNLQYKVFNVFIQKRNQTIENIEKICTLRLQKYFDFFSKAVRISSANVHLNSTADRFRRRTLKRKTFMALAKNHSNRRWAPKEGVIRLQITKTCLERYSKASLQITSRIPLTSDIKVLVGAHSSLNK